MRRKKNHCEACPPGQQVPQGASQPVISEALGSLIEQAKGQNKWPLARLISIFEADTQAAQQARHAIMSHIQDNPREFSKQAIILGFTGAPGAGKSSLIGELCLHFLEHGQDITVAVLAVDPSSQRSGGAILGDRTRTRFPVNDNRIFFRSQASDMDLGGVARKTFQVTRLLRHFFDFIIIETVGVGQSEVEVEQLSDHTCLVLQPFAGDQIQFMKAGVMEVPDTFVINKCDEDSLARKSFNVLKSSLKLFHVTIDVAGTGSTGKNAKSIFLTSALKRKGVDELATFLLSLAHDPSIRKNLRDQESWYLKKWIQEEYGRYGVSLYERYESSRFKALKTYEEKASAFDGVIKSIMPSLEDRQ